MRYFDHLHDVAEIKKLYRQLAMENHPDHGGDTATMQEINSQYADALQRADGQKSTDSRGKTHTYHYNADIEQAIMDKIAELIAAGVAQRADIALIGTWIWVTGDTKPVKDTLKASGCTWHSKRRCWYWHNGPRRSRYARGASLSDLAEKYGETRFKDRQEQERERDRQHIAA